MRRVVALVAACLLAGCSASVSSGEAGATQEPIQGLLSVHHLVAADGTVLESTALVGAVNAAPANAAIALTLLAGLAPSGTPGQCTSSRLATEMPESVLELVDVGDVELSTDASGRAALLPRAFPTLSNVMSGVVYTSPERSADALPASAAYHLVAGGDTAIDVTASAPSALVDVTLDGTPLSEVTKLAADAPLVLSWTAGDPADRIVVELVAGSSMLTCTFADEGNAVVAASALEAVADGRLSLRRERVVALTGRGADRGWARFDFERSARVAFTR